MKIEIKGMHCDACIRRVRKALEGVEGLQVEDVKVGSVEVKSTPDAQGTAALAAAAAAIQNAGYAVRP